jgi:hypothetical protein
MIARRTRSLALAAVALTLMAGWARVSTGAVLKREDL